MKTNLPTTPGTYWWREKDGDEWVFIYVELIRGDLFAGSKGTHTDLCAYLDQWERFYPVGQWAKAHSPDEGIEAWAVFVDGEIRCHTISSRKPDAEAQLGFYQNNHFNKKWTCEPVTIFRNQKQK